MNELNGMRYQTRHWIRYKVVEIHDINNNFVNHNSVDLFVSFLPTAKNISNNNNTLGTEEEIHTRYCPVVPLLSHYNDTAAWSVCWGWHALSNPDMKWIRVLWLRRKISVGNWVYCCALTLSSSVSLGIRRRFVVATSHFTRLHNIPLWKKVYPNVDKFNLVVAQTKAQKTSGLTWEYDEVHNRHQMQYANLMHFLSLSPAEQELSSC